jgi:UDP-N-acetylmuramate dehydrogenase
MPQTDSGRKAYPMFRQEVDLTPYNTLGVKARAKRFAEVKNKQELEVLGRSGLFGESRPFVLGGGSNILFRGDIAATVLKISIPGIAVTAETDSYVMVEAGAGEVWHDLVSWCVERGYGGIENLALIPGTCGAAPIQNIGAYGTELEQVFEKLELFEIDSGRFRTFTHDMCGFGYRDSRFKRDLKGKVIVTSITLKLTQAPHHINTSYYALESYLSEKGIASPGIKDVFDAVIAIRKSKLPDPSLIGNAGSFFKNPVIDKAQFQHLKKKYPDVPSFAAGDGHVKVPAGWLIEKAGWKGKRVGNVGTYHNQALVIVNHGGATGAELFNHAMKIRDSVQELFGISLTPEVNIAGGKNGGS